MSFLRAEYTVDMIFSDIESYQNCIEPFLENEIKKISDNFDKERVNKPKEYSDEYDDWLFDIYLNEYHQFRNIITNNFRGLLITQIISIIENELKLICNRYGTNNNQKFKVDDIVGNSDLEKCKTYLKKISEIDFGKFNEEWLFIKNCKIIRNKIVHNDSKVHLDDKIIMDFIEKNCSISYENQPYLEKNTAQFKIINRGLTDELIRQGKEFFIKLLKELKLYT
jgi:hypothetical protein